MGSNILKATFRNNAILKGVLVGLTISSIVVFIGFVYMLINNIDASTIVSMFKEFDLGNELIKFIVNSIK